MNLYVIKGIHNKDIKECLYFTVFKYTTVISVLQVLAATDA